MTEEEIGGWEGRDFKKINGAVNSSPNIIMVIKLKMERVLFIASIRRIRKVYTEC
jgi:hypothetical protein